MIYLLYGFVFGALIPYISRRFNKFMPATLGYAIYRIIKPVKMVKNSSLKKKHLAKKYFYRSVMMGLFVGLLFYIFFLTFGPQFLFWKLLFLWLLILLAEIDYRMMLLPDIITFPLVLLGVFASMLGVGFTDIINSSFGSLFGYFLPVIASMFLVWKNKDVFGGGDVKLLSAIGAWVGVSSLLFAIILSAIGFGIYALIKKKRGGAYGPWLVGSTIVIVLLFL